MCVVDFTPQRGLSRIAFRFFFQKKELDPVSTVFIDNSDSDPLPERRRK